MQKKRILIVASASFSLIQFRGDFIKSLIKNGFIVFTAAPDYKSNEVMEKLNQLGVTPILINLQRTGLNPFVDLKTIYQLKNIIKVYKIDLVFPYTVKPVIYSSIAGNLTKTPVVSLITGLGFAFTGLTFKSRLLQKLNEVLYKISIRKNKIVIFQNPDDYELFLKRNILKKSNKVGLVSGSGVNLKNYKYRENNTSKDVISFLFVARLIKEKGISLYLDAAEKLKKTYPKAEFHVIGIIENSPSAIKLERLTQLDEKGIIKYHGFQNNVPSHLYKRDVFVLPTYYREGIPRSILEALSVGLPIITTNAPGCKETVLEKQNGILITPNNLNELVSAMEFFLTNKLKIKEMGINSRLYAKKRFDVKIINADLIGFLKDALNF